MSKVSIIIPTFNRDYLIQETLNSILHQNYTNWECIIIDDGSSDNTEKIIQKYFLEDNRFKYYKRPSNRPKGPSTCRNLGFELSQGNYIQWFDSDDIMLPNHLLDKITLFKETELDAVVSNLLFVTNHCKDVIKKNNIFSNSTLRDYFLGNVAYYVCGGLWKRTFLEKQIELFDETITNLDDWDFNIRMLLSNPKVLLIDNSSILYRQSENSLIQEINKVNPKEIRSEIKARIKIKNLIGKNSVFDRNCQVFLINRLLFLYKISLPKKELALAFFIFNETLKVDPQLFFFKRLLIYLKSLIAFFAYLIIGKGYFLLDNSLNIQNENISGVDSWNAHNKVD